MSRIQRRTEVLEPTSPRGFWHAFGPGLLWAGSAIGVSHLVQSTRAGADAGFSLLWIILLALALKYPFFEYGPRYAAATGESLVEGYRRVGRWALWAYFLITLSTALVVQSAVGLFTAFVFSYAFGIDASVAAMGAIVIAGAAGLLWVGRFRLLDRTIKAVLLLLAGCTLVAALISLPRIGESEWAPWPLASGGGVATFAFTLALAGWMPSAIDISVWSSLWTLAKGRESGVKATVREALLDFRIGYAGTGVIALGFLTLGATVMHTSGERFSPDGTTFSLQLVELYAETLGAWVRPVMLIAVGTTMFSTLLTVLDGFPRAITRTLHVLRNGVDTAYDDEVGRTYWVVLLVLAVLTVGVFLFFAGNLTAMVDFATIVSFITAPVLGYINLRAVTGAEVPEAYRPGTRMRGFSYLGLGLMVAVGVAFMASILI